MMRRIALAALFVLAACAPTVKPLPEKLELEPVSFTQAQGWMQDQQSEALPALIKSCAVWEKRNPAWRNPCDQARALPQGDDEAARAFFENAFTPHRITNADDGLFTGYYEAQLRGAWTRGGAYQTPLWQRPADMLNIDLGAFRDSLKGQKITGKIAGKNFVPYDDRAVVASGSLQGRAQPLLWVDDPIGAFFLEIQGSGQIVMEDGSMVRVGYDAQNGHGYTAIGRVLADRGAVERPVTMQKIRAWLAAHPDQAQEIMNTNPSVVFFRKSDKDGAVGAQGVTLTPARSLAVDPAFVALGTPLWLSTAQRSQLVIAQDTGGAIKGPVRGDLFLGAGAAAENEAGAMQEKGRYLILWPKGVALP